MVTLLKTGLSVAVASIIATNVREASAILVKKDLETTIGEAMSSREHSILFLTPSLLFLCTVFN